MKSICTSTTFRVAGYFWLIYYYTIYIGNYENNKPNGHGKMTENDGTVYEGNYVDGVMSG